METQTKAEIQGEMRGGFGHLFSLLLILQDAADARVVAAGERLVVAQARHLAQLAQQCEEAA